MSKPKRLLAALPHFIIALFFLQTALVLYAPGPLQSERLWFEWLGKQILTHGEIPRALGSEGLLGAGTPWIAHEWLFGVALAWSAAHGLDTLAIIALTAITTVPLLCTYLRLRRTGAGPAAIAVALLCICAVLFPQTQMRASFVAYAVFAIVCAALNCHDRRQFVIPVLVFVLANVHAAVTLLAALPALAAVAEFALRRRFDCDVRRLALTAVMTIGTSACSPFGFAVYGYAGSFGGGTHMYIAEWTPLFSDLESSIAQTDLTISAICIVLLYLWRRQTPLRAVEWVPLLVTGALMCSSERFAVLFIVAAAPLAFRHGLRTPKLAFAPLQSAPAAVLLMAMTMAPNVVWAIRHAGFDAAVHLPDRPGLAMPPVWLEPVHVGMPARERVFCANFAYCNAYLWAGARVLLDGRADPFPLEAYRMTRRLNRCEPGWREALDRLDVNVIVFERTESKLKTAIEHAAQWRRAGESPDTVTYVRGDLSIK